MLNEEKYSIYITKYKKIFASERWSTEKYKWQAIKCFQDNWDIDASDFGDMFKRSTDKCGNLLAASNFFPKGMIQEFIKSDAEYVRDMFRNLYDESENVAERIKHFIQLSDDFKTSHGLGRWRNHFQNTNSISVYLWLMYPDKYYIYKSSIYKIVAKELESDFCPKNGDIVYNIANGFSFYDDICSRLNSDIELRKIFDSIATDDCYRDPVFKTMTIDFGVYIWRNIKMSEKDNINTDTNDDIKHYWTYSPGENNSEWENNKKNGEMTIGWTFLDDLSEYQSKDDIKVAIQRYVGDESSHKNDVLTTWNFSHVIKEGDIIYAKSSRSTFCARGEVISDYIYDDTRKTHKNIRKVEWQIKDVTSPTGMMAAMKTLTDISDFTDYVNQLEEAFTGDLPAEDVQSSEKYDKEDFLQEVFISEKDYNTVVNLLKHKKNLILQGAPGVGKTFAAKRLAYSIIGKKEASRVMLIQFHQSYSYEDFIMGFRPKQEGGFEIKNGPFYEFCKKAQDDEGNPYFFIIDEINRGNLSKIFGELLMLIEEDKRGEKLRLLYDNQLFSVPKNVYIIGMMNTADRSLAMIDYALRRRFAFYTMNPAFENKKFIDSLKYDGNKDKVLKVIECIKSINKDISEDETLGKGFCIGHSYFCMNEEITDDILRNIIDYEIIPLLSEYWFDDPGKINKWEDNLKGIL